MATPRRPLGEINGNITPFKDLSPYIRGKIIAKYKDGIKPAQIAKQLNIPDSTIRDTISKDIVRNEGVSRARPGRPDKYSERFKRNLISFVRKEPKASIAKIRKHMQSKISNGCITKILKATGMWHWKYKKRPYLTDEVAAKRLAWCLARKDWTVLDFIKYIFSDECSAERGAGRAQEWA